MVGSLEEWLLITQRSEALVEATDPRLIADLELRFGIDQQTAVAHFLESTDWGVETFPQYQGANGSFAERLEALRSKWTDWKLS